MSLLRTLQDLSKKDEKKIFETANLALVDKDGRCYTKRYDGGPSLNEENIPEGKSVVTVRDDKGVVHVLGENCR
jgi:hypothetical protein